MIPSNITREDILKALGEIYNAFEAESFIANEKNISSQGECNFLRGVLGGIWNIYTEKECQVKEVKCVAKGDELCEFNVTPQKE